MDLECDMFYVIFWALFFLRVLLYFVKATNNHGIVRIPYLGSDRIFTSFFYGNPSLINLIYFQARSFPKQDLVDFATKRTFERLLACFAQFFSNNQQIRGGHFN